MPPAPLVQSDRVRHALVALAMVAVLAFALGLAALYGRAAEAHFTPPDLHAVTIDSFALQVPAGWKAYAGGGAAVSHWYVDPDDPHRQITISPIASFAPNPRILLDAAVSRFAIAPMRELYPEGIHAEFSPAQRLDDGRAYWCTGDSTNGYFHHHHVVAVVSGRDHRHLAIALTAFAPSPRQAEADLELVFAIARSVTASPEGGQTTDPPPPPTNTAMRLAPEIHDHPRSSAMLNPVTLSLSYEP